MRAVGVQQGGGCHVRWERSGGAALGSMPCAAAFPHAVPGPSSHWACARSPTWHAPCRLTPPRPALPCPLPPSHTTGKALQQAFNLKADPLNAALITRLQQQRLSTEQAEQLAHLCAAYDATLRAGGAAALPGMPHLDVWALGDVLLDIVAPSLRSLLGQTRHDQEPLGGTHRSVAAGAAVLSQLQAGGDAAAALAGAGGDVTLAHMQLTYAVAAGFSQATELALRFAVQTSHDHPGAARRGAGAGWLVQCSA